MIGQSLQYGTPMSQALRASPRRLRRDSLIKLEDRAHKLAAKLTVPMVLFLLPANLVIRRRSVSESPRKPFTWVTRDPNVRMDWIVPMSSEDKNSDSIPARRQEVRAAAARLRADRRGVVALEFLLVAPVLFLILFAVLYFGLWLNAELILTNAADQGAQTLALGRGTTTAYNDTKSAINAVAANLNTSNITPTLTVNGSPCTSSSCTLTSGATAAVALTYPCSAFPGFGFTFGSSKTCTLSAQSAAIVQ